jgi:thioesterase domain-containing protein/acyl carrier protein
VVVVGDVRSRPLLEPFHASVQLFQAPDNVKTSLLHQRTQNAIRQEEELVIDPAFFYALRRHLPRISNVQVLLKRGEHHNEMNCFRYDVILQVGEPLYAAAETHWLDWQQQGLAAEQLRSLLQEQRPELLGLRNLPNPRTLEAVRTAALLRTPDQVSNAGELRQALQSQPQPPTLDPEELCRLGEALGYRVIISDVLGGPQGSYEALFQRSGSDPAAERWAGFPEPDAQARHDSDYTNNPLRTRGVQRLPAQLRDFLADRLPDYMQPSAIIVLNSIPLTPNGKVDRRALPAPDQSRSFVEGTLVAPRDALEQRLVHIWEDLLGVHPIGIHDNFFLLGGHSLLAVRLMARIQQQFAHDLPITALFQNATIEQLASLLRSPAGAQQWSPLIVIQAGGERPPLFCVHPAGGSVLCYAELARRLGPDQPVYGLQSAGIDSDLLPPERVEDFAAQYVAAIRSVQPSGPYLVSGWSVGGVIAFEIARQLTQQGAAVALLALFDSGVLSHTAPERQLDDADILAEIALLSNLPLTAEQLRQHSPEEQLRLLVTQAEQAQALPADVSADQMRRWLQVYRTHYRAYQRYQPQPYAGPITLFRARDGAGAHVHDRTIGWQPYALHSINVIDIPGDHYALIVGESVDTLAQHLQQAISQAASDQLAPA